MPRQNVITLVTVTGYTFVRDALPVRQRPGTEPEPAPGGEPAGRIHMKKAPLLQLVHDSPFGMNVTVGSSFALVKRLPQREASSLEKSEAAPRTRWKMSFIREAIRRLESPASTS